MKMKKYKTIMKTKIIFDETNKQADKQIQNEYVNMQFDDM